MKTKLVAYEVYKGNHSAGKNVALKGGALASYAYAAANEGREDLVECVALSRAGISVADQRRRGHGNFVTIYAYRVLDADKLTKFIEKNYPELIG